MAVSVAWSVLFLFLIFIGILLIVYQSYTKVTWQNRASKLEEEKLKLAKEIKNLKKQPSAQSIVKKEYDAFLAELKDKLKGRKYEIFLLSIKGYSSKEIAAKLYIVEATVNSHMKEILTILNVKARKELPSIIINKILELEKIE